MSEPRPTILVIEDEPPLQKFLRATLENEGYSVVVAGRGEEGLRHASVGQPDLIILDLGLPDMDGMEVTRRLREWMAVPI
ncbi:MAG TPA: response regulator, partial [Bryobacteraceae bacterium]|nr:response regulator [Bryobacteraceae bacterium]